MAVETRDVWLHAGGAKLFGTWFVPRDPADPARTVVLLHHGLGSVSQWRDFPAALANRVRLPVFAYDRQGYGRSAPLTSPRTVGYIHEQGLEVLPEVLAAAGIERPILLGHSEGGSMAMIFAATYPGRPRGVVSEAGHAFVEDVNLAHIRRVEHAFTEDDLGEKLRKHHGDQTEAMFRAWSETWLNPEFHGWDIGELLPRISCPVLAVLGADDPYETPAQLRVLRAGIAAPLETVLLPQCGHTPHHEARDRFLPLVARFINVLEPD